MSTIHLTNTNFEKEVLNSDKPVLVDFWAGWCGPCRILSPVIEELAGEVKNIKFCKINVDEQPELAEKYDIMSIPTLLFFKKGKIELKSVGVQSKSNIVKMINE